MKRIVMIWTISCLSASAQMIYDSGTTEYRNLDIRTTPTSDYSANVRIRDIETSTVTTGRLSSDGAAGYTGFVSDYEGHTYRTQIDSYGNKRMQKLY